MPPTERYLSIDSKMKGSPLSLEEVMKTNCCYVPEGTTIINYFLPWLADDFDDDLLLNSLLRNRRLLDETKEMGNFF